MCITGGAQGLGRELAAYFAYDHQIVILDIDKESVTFVGDKLGCSHYVCDVSDYKSVEKTIKTIIKKYKKIDCLINCAGVYIDGEVVSNDPELMKKVINVNVLGPMNMCKYVIPHMKKRKLGTIININSTAGLRPKAFNAVYHASKWALSGFTESLQVELSPYNIKIIDIHPGLMKTKFTNGTNCDMSKSMDPSEVVSTIEFILSFKKDIYIPKLVIKHI